MLFCFFFKRERYLDGCVSRNRKRVHSNHFRRCKSRFFFSLFCICFWNQSAFRSFSPGWWKFSDCEKSCHLYDGLSNWTSSRYMEALSAGGETALLLSIRDAATFCRLVVLGFLSFYPTPAYAFIDVFFRNERRIRIEEIRGRRGLLIILKWKTCCYLLGWPSAHEWGSSKSPQMASSKLREWCKILNHSFTVSVPTSSLQAVLLFYFKTDQPFWI